MVETLYRADTEALETAWQAAAEAAGIGQAVQAAIDAAQPISGPRVARKRRRIAARARRAWLETPAGRAVAAEIEARRDEIQTAWQAEQDAKAAAEAAARRATPAARRRADLLRAARVARSLGCEMKVSKDRAGRISSYYVEEPFDSWWARTGGRGWEIQLRISDHDIPSTWARETRAEFNGRGSYDGSADIYASAAPIRRSLWCRRAFTLAFAGRDVPRCGG
ncbi:MAG: hypothetical protein OXE86_21450 [Alphaproteobacteria bacterium]|nr:hypothetical protein [Alphaproteobacteria bacterium]